MQLQRDRFNEKEIVIALGTLEYHNDRVLEEIWGKEGKPPPEMRCQIKDCPEEAIIENINRSSGEQFKSCPKHMPIEANWEHRDI